MAKKAPAAALPRRDAPAAKKPPTPAPKPAPKPAPAAKAALGPKTAAKAPKPIAAAKPGVPAKPTKPAAAAKPPPKPAPLAKAEAKAKVLPPAKTEAKSETKGKPAAKVAAQASKPDPKAKAAATKPETKAKGPAKPAPAPKAEKAPPAAKAAKAEKPAKPAPAPKAEKPAASAKPAAPAKGKKGKAPPEPRVMPTKPTHSGPPRAVAAGKTAPVLRPIASARPVSIAPKPLAAPKPTAPAPEIVGDSQPVPAFKGNAAGAKNLVLVGAIAGAFGVKGEVRLRAFTAQKTGVISYGPLYGEDGKVLMRPKSWRELKDGVAVVAPEVKTREQAEAMRGTRLFIPRANLPKTAEDEFYIVDLLGSRAEALDGTHLGEIVAVWNFGAGDILEYRPPNGGPNVRITFTRETAPYVDLAGKRLVIDPPAPEPEGK